MALVPLVWTLLSGHLSVSGGFDKEKFLAFCFEQSCSLLPKLAPETQERILKTLGLPPNKALPQSLADDPEKVKALWKRVKAAYNRLLRSQTAPIAEPLDLPGLSTALNALLRPALTLFHRAVFAVHPQWRLLVDTSRLSQDPVAIKIAEVVVELGLKPLPFVSSDGIPGGHIALKLPAGSLEALRMLDPMVIVTQVCSTILSLAVDPIARSPFATLPSAAVFLKLLPVGPSITTRPPLKSKCTKKDLRRVASRGTETHPQMTGDSIPSQALGTRPLLLSRHLQWARLPKSLASDSMETSPQKRSKSA